MAKLLMNLRHVPDDEAADVRAMLGRAGIAFYETAPSLWGISSGGIWLEDDGDLVEAKRLMAAYQEQRRARARAEYAAARSDGSAGTFWTELRREPGRVLLALAAIAVLLALVAFPVILLWR